ncbi:hypothetical protein OO184_02220 [Photorhabdus sp. APURE]|uniref:hypothetical protein n=1 Tax=Photorhabdus aballayi TaxID=2991723 RepID=UPI00223E11EC|nr:hypothetical protein [Photorhabdus aballayi]MCW7546793.1 hypothetical protein [Photorhabdus aballayi]
MNEFIYSVKDRITIIAIVFSNSSLSFYNDTFVNKPVVTRFISSTGYFKHWRTEQQTGVDMFRKRL